jgi:protein tyrosine/serine phosphatase
MKGRDDVEWVIADTLARGRRPGYFQGSAVTASVVEAWIDKVKALRVKSIICLLGDDQLGYYSALESDLLAYYRAQGFEVAHVPALDHQRPPLTPDHLTAIWKAYQDLPKPVLIHCSAGLDRTGLAIEYLQRRLQQPS